MLRVTLLSVSLQVTLWKMTQAPGEPQCSHVQLARGNSTGREKYLSAGPSWCLGTHMMEGESSLL